MVSLLLLIEQWARSHGVWLGEQARSHTPWLLAHTIGVKPAHEENRYSVKLPYGIK